MQFGPHANKWSFGKLLSWFSYSENSILPALCVHRKPEFWGFSLLFDFIICMQPYLLKQIVLLLTFPAGHFKCVQISVRPLYRCRFLHFLVHIPA